MRAGRLLQHTAFHFPLMLLSCNASAMTGQHSSGRRAKLGLRGAHRVLYIGSAPRFAPAGRQLVDLHRDLPHRVQVVRLQRMPPSPQHLALKCDSFGVRVSLAQLGRSYACERKAPSLAA